MSDYAHGHRSTYTAGCRCGKCRAANCSYARRQYRSPEAAIVSAQRARRHLRKLAKAGVGRRRASRASGVSESVLSSVRTGRRRKIHLRTEREILRLRKDTRTKETLVPIGPTLKRIEALVDEGYTLKELGKRLGFKSVLRLRCQRITQRRAEQIEALYQAIME